MRPSIRRRHSRAVGQFQPRRTCSASSPARMRGSGRESPSATDLEIYLRVVQHGKDSLRVTSASLYRSKSHPVLRKTQENLWCGSQDWHCPGSCEFHVAMGSVSPCPPGQGHSSELGMLQDAAPTHPMPLGLTPLELGHQLSPCFLSIHCPREGFAP